jgi:cation:H+ antiporter
LSRPAALLAVAAAAALPSIVLRWGAIHVDPVTGIFVFGLGILASAFLVAWAAELAQLEISQSLAIIVVALLAVLPEYAVDLYFAWTAATRPEYASYALANMTGANRLLVGIGWPLIALLFWWRTGKRAIELEESHGGEVFFLGLATLYSLLIPLKGSLNLFDTAVLLILFGLYLRFASMQEVEEPELTGPPAMLSRLPRIPRRLANLTLFSFAAFGIFSSAEPFAESLVAGGTALGINEFYLVQWLAPLASESPELLVAGLWCWKGFPTAGLGTLISSKVNQWSLLVGTVPLVYALALLASGQKVATMALDTRQFGEILLTGAQSYLAVTVILGLRFRLLAAGWLAFLFLTQLGVTIAIEEMKPPEMELWLLREKFFFSTLYLLVGTFFLARHHRRIPQLVRTAFPKRVPKA